MSKSVKGKVDDLLSTESHQLPKQKVLKICAVMEALVYGAKKDSTTKQRQFLVHRNSGWQTATICSDPDCQKAIERFDPEIHQVTEDKCKLFDNLYQHHEQQQLQEVRTKATGPSSIFATELLLQLAAAEKEAYGEANMTAEKRL
jgi:hypothetical protein